MSRHGPRTTAELVHPPWSRSAGIYQLNQRHFTPEGTLRAAEAHLPRISELGVGVVWLMPINPIGTVNRKGRLGSPYAVRDHLEVNPEFGDLDDLRHFVSAAHSQGLRVILDWVANHTAWDHVLVDAHPEWYARDWRGALRPTPWWDWHDVVDLDYTHEPLRDYMAGAMCHWVRETDVDGFRCDVAGFVPLDFWERVRVELEEIKPVFMLAEWETRDLHGRAFDASYAWSWNAAVREVASGNADLEPLRTYYAWNYGSWPRDAMRMTFVSNHDHNAWEGTEFEHFGDALSAAVVLSVVGEGMPLIYNGQEAGSNRRLSFFDKDVIDWREHEQGDLYRSLLALKRSHRALWNGAWGAPMVQVGNSSDKTCLTFVRHHPADPTTGQPADRVFAAINFSSTRAEVTLLAGPYAGSYRNPDTGETVTLTAGAELSVGPWSWLILVGET